METMQTNPKKRGFAAMTQEQRQRIASMGGRTAHANGKAHQWDSVAAKAARDRRTELERAKKA